MTKMIKSALLCYYKFGRATFAVTEFTYYYGIADVMAFNKKEKVITEIEVKISKQDLLNEIKQKEKKHQLLKTCYNYSNYNLVPNKFYFWVEEHLLETAKYVVNNLNSKYGILLFKKIKRPQDSIFVIKRAYSLHKQMFSDDAYRQILERMNNENCALYKKLYWR